jgi:predicted nuclease with TOPRIM domain
MAEYKNMLSILEAQKISYEKRSAEVKESLDKLTKLIAQYDAVLGPEGQERLSPMRESVSKLRAYYENTCKMVASINSALSLEKMIEAQKTGKLWTCDEELRSLLETVGISPEEVERGLNAPGGPEPYINELIKRLGLQEE